MNYFRIIKRATLIAYYVKHIAAKKAIELWYHEIKDQEFKNFNELKAVYKNASLVAHNRIVFNIKGNDYRLVVKMNFHTRQILLFGLGLTMNMTKLMLRRSPIKISKMAMQQWTILKNEEDYTRAIERLDEIFDVDPGSELFAEAELLGLLISEYEDIHYPISTPAPLEAIRLRMSELGLKNKDLEQYIGSKGYVSSILSGKREITLRIASILHTKLGIPAHIFLRMSAK